MSTKPTIVYWDLCARAHIAKVLLHAGGVEFDIDTATANTWPAPKEEMPFGQLPVLKHGDLVIAQSKAINNYCARLAGLYPTDAAEAAFCDMCIEECTDKFSLLSKVSSEISYHQRSGY